MFINRQTNVNTVLLRSLPLNKDMKRYYVRRYDHLCKHNGQKFASEVFKKLKELLLEYRSDVWRSHRLESYIERAPVRKNGWLRMMFKYVDSHPHFVFNFLKLYTALPEPLICVEMAEHRMDFDLSEIDVNTKVPWKLKKWLAHFVERRRPWSRKEYETLASQAKYFLESDLGYGEIRDQSGLLERFAASHSYPQYRKYWHTWNRRLRPSNLTKQDSLNQLSQKFVYPDVYKDFQIERLSSEAFMHDVFQLASWAKANGVGLGEWADCVYDLDDINFMFQPLNRELVVRVIHEYSAETKRYVSKHGLNSYVGQIHHIPKGGTVDRRSIAVPNRFVQQSLVPAHRALEEIVRRLPHDATFDQSRFDTYLQNRVNNENLYIGSVDLSRATDNLPFSWGIAIVEAVGLPNEVAQQSWDLFKKTARSNWANGPYLSRWEHGQPLGTLPSFMVLALTHNLYLESLALFEGIGHSPYRVLGDDVVIASKKLRKAYMRDLGHRNIPISHHKSFDGNLTEFAGKTYIKNMRPFYTPDHGPITWNSLFDYQRSSGITIPYNHLPRDIQKKIERIGNRIGLPRSMNTSAYKIALKSEIMPRGSSNILDVSYIDTYYRLRPDPDQKFDPEFFSGIVSLAGHPITVGDFDFAHKNGYFQRYRRIVPDWFTKKVRPIATDIIIETAMKTVVQEERTHL